MGRPHPLMNEQELEQWILRQMGAPLVKVEITGDQLCDCIADSIEWFTAHKGVFKQMSVQITPNVSEYPLPDEVDTIIDVALPGNKMDLSLVFSPYTLIDEKVPYDVFAAPSTQGVYSSFAQTLQYIETAKRILSADPDWRQDGRLLRVFPRPREFGVMIWDYKTSVEAIEKLNQRDHELLKKYAYALAKRIVGRVRSKYDTYPTAQGNVSLDGKLLLEEAEREIEALTEALDLSGFPMGFMAG